MIAQVLNRKFVTDQLVIARAQLAEDAKAGQQRRSAPAESQDLTPEDYQLALQQVDESLTREEIASSGQIGYEAPPPERRGEMQCASIDDFSYFSRDPVISMMQSVLDEYLEEHGTSDAERVQSQEPSDDRRRDATDDVAITDRSLELEPVRDAEGRRLFGEFEVTDPGWISSALAMGIRMFRGRHQFPTKPPAPLQISDTSRFVVVGDWGSGIPRAQKVAKQMGRYIDGDKRENREVHVIHLGDVYYSGFKREYQKRFLPFWPVRPESAGEIGSWSLNGNHDMYSGGHAYFDFLLAEPRFSKQGGASYFSFYNNHWKLLALDTAWADADLVDPQLAWANRIVTGSNSKVILLSHHQLFSAYEKVGTALGTKLQTLLDGNRVRAWLWGHEHRCMFFAPFQNVKYARCIGHGGVPVYMWHHPNDPYPEPGTYEYREIIDKGLEHWALFGFSVLDFDGPTFRVRYVDENGYEHKEETIL